jgi:hypothetical protein
LAQKATHKMLKLTPGEKDGVVVGNGENVVVVAVEAVVEADEVVVDDDEVVVLL